MNFFLYARKSTDDEERQILSIEAQLAELREFARKESLAIVDEFIESKTAKVPGRSVFNTMMERIERGEAAGILAWHPDRLARNLVDGGRIIYLLDTGKLVALKFPTFWFESTPQGKFMLNIAFGQSKYYVDNLSENVRRGIRQKLRRGEFPGKPPIGYLNEPRLRTIVVDPESAPLVRRMFETYAAGQFTLKEVRKQLASWGLVNRAGKALALGSIKRLLMHPFYVGLFYTQLCRTVLAVARRQSDIVVENEFGALRLVGSKAGCNLFEQGKCLTVVDGVSDARGVVDASGAFVCDAAGTDGRMNISEQLRFSAADTDNELTILAAMFA